MEGFEINYHTPLLETALLVIAGIFPSGFCANMTALIRGRRWFWQGQSLSENLAGFVFGYAVILAVMAPMRPQQVLAFQRPTFLWLWLLAPFAGMVCILLEYLAGMSFLFLRTGKLVTAVEVHSSYSAVSRITALDILSILALVIGEELILRQLLFHLLATDLALSPWMAILLCTAAYASNHLGFGIASVVSKLPGGLLYVFLFYGSGLAIGVVIVAHATQNLALLAWSRRSRH